MFYEGETAKEDHIRVCVDVMHEQGHTEKKHADIAIQTTGIAGKAMMTLVHGQGSAFSYGRRYLSCLIFNIPTGDDDGNLAGSQPVFISEVQIKLLKDERAKRKIDGPKFLNHFKVKSIEEIPAKRFKEAMQVMKAKALAPKEEKESPELGPERETGSDDDEKPEQEEWMDGKPEQGEML